jgi:hypothetical protein
MGVFVFEFKDSHKMFISEILKYNYFIIDLANTLYNENDYTMIAYEKISEYGAKLTNCSALK